jgi:exodeoxyribonuclease V alpha subunit
MIEKLIIHVKLSKTIFSHENYQVVVFNAISKNVDKSSFIAVGEIPKLTKHEELLIKGHFAKKEGKTQFEVESWKRPEPSSKEQIISFFSSSLFRGIGKKTAKKIYDVLGSKAIVKINNQGMKALERVEGLSKEKAAEITLITQQTFLLNDIIEQYQKHGVRSDIILKAHSKLGNRIIELKENPYLLAQYNLLHFYTCDEIGKRIGILPHSFKRLEAVLLLYLKEINRIYGHCYIEETELIEKCLELLNKHALDEIDHVHPMSFIAVMEESKHCYIEEGKVYPTHLFFAEKNVAEKVHQLTLADNQFDSLRLEQAICRFEKENHLELSYEQRQAINHLIQENFLILTGGPGTGKTFCVNAILQVYKQLFPDHRVSLAAPTGRAAKRLGEVTGVGNQVQTIHRLLGIGYNGLEQPQFNKENMIDCNLIIIEEFSMVDIELSQYLFNAIQLGTKVLIVGDPDQLPSVKPGNVLKDCLDAGLPQVRLTQIFRQAQNSTIVKNAHKINKGQMIDLENKKDHYFIESNDSNRTAYLITHSVKKLLAQGEQLNDIMVLSPMKQGDAGVYRLNQMIQELINPKNEKKKEVKFKDTLFRVGDKVMYLVNNRQLDIYNGDIGIIKNINKTNSTITIDIEGNIKILEKEQWKNIQIAYCSTIHKVQGCQSKINIMCLTDEQHVMLYRNLFYTGITRTEKMFILIGSKTSIEKAVITNRVNSRKTSLKDKIQKHRKYVAHYQKSKIS